MALVHGVGASQTLAVTTKRVPEGLGLPETLRALEHRTIACLEGLVGRTALVPDLVMVEQPGGNNTKKLHMAQGVITKALCGYAVFDVPFSTWRKEVLGRGNATKQDAIDRAKLMGFEGSEDECEALMIAEYGRRMATVEAA